MDAEVIGQVFQRRPVLAFTDDDQAYGPLSADQCKSAQKGRKILLPAQTASAQDNRDVIAKPWMVHRWHVEAGWSQQGVIDRRDVGGLEAGDLGKIHADIVGDGDNAVGGGIKRLYESGKLGSLPMFGGTPDGFGNMPALTDHETCSDIDAFLRKDGREVPECLG